MQSLCTKDFIYIIFQYIFIERLSLESLSYLWGVVVQDCCMWCAGTHKTLDRGVGVEADAGALSGGRHSLALLW